MELPIDHFRLLGVSPTTDLQALLHTLQQRIDRAPDQGFTQDTLLAREELLRASADLLSDASRRQAYESDLTALAGSEQSVMPALDVPTSKDVGGLLLLLEAGQAFDCFEIACRALQPPQAPALGSTREADLTLLAGLACLAAAADLHQQRRYEAAAQTLQRGQQLLQRMGQLPAIRQQLSDELDNLRPYRVLDLLSRNLTAQAERAEGLALLEELVARRGGLEGFGDPSMGPEEFQAFFKQIRAFLTVQEQVDLFSRWAPTSAAADFLASTALTASGFAQRKPERIAAARQRLEASGQEGVQPLLACQHLLLGQVEQARAAFEQGATPDLKRWADQQSPDPLAQLCAYCRDWLARDVLPGYRDLEADPDLEAYFADRDVQTYVEQHDRPPAPAVTGSILPWGVAVDSGSPAETTTQPLTPVNDDDGDWDGDGWNPGAWLETMRSNWRWPQLERPSRSTATAAAVGAGVVLVAIASVMRPLPPTPTPLPVEASKPTAPPAPAPAPATLPLRAEAPSEAQVQALLEAWLDAKASILAGKNSRIPLEVLARPSQVDRLEAERDSDQARGETQTISTAITSMAIDEQGANRIAATVNLRYADQRLNAKGDPQGEPTKLELRNRYVFGRDGGIWRLVSFQKAP
ncbi:ARC6/PARC6 family protein [Cyanobium sp. Aljojuca 7D2]|uniref:IMS domain-containing protein n=1 Tax=Cyanobium sp. Aljojuca 7D2 TaxID=2823698 RepID=UPI0020CB8C86|nr:IMS domain-containing protein [Cyanobium sp. Aljojuca 7D2]MCP9891919.1 ARC6/PARC6 family protein [Cyanobium sp. Aljojuca 7D2]